MTDPVRTASKNSWWFAPPSCLAMLVVGLAFGQPANAADPPTLKDTLGKVQSDAETKAVEDLIDKLKGVSRKTAPAAPAPLPAATAPAPPAAAAPAPAAPPPVVAAPSPPAPTGPATTTSPFEPPPARVATPPAPEPETTKPDDAVRRAALNTAPSVDLEVFFDYKSIDITPAAAAALTPLGRALSDARLSGDRFLIAGHTDIKGGAAYNLDLSRQRAEAVRQFLIDKFGIDGAKLVANGMGSKHLKNPKQPLAAENRRVQIVNLSKDQDGKPRGN
jgi:outer membrane protein OmpA-like peptidoglycan-associated protein